MPTTINGVVIQDEAASDLTGSLTTPVASNDLTITRLGAYATGSGANSSEVVAYDPATFHLFVMNNVTDKVEIVDFSDPAAMTKIGEIDVGAVAQYGGMNSVAVANGILAVAIQNAEGDENGFVALYSTAGGAPLKVIEVGNLPDMLTFTPDGTKLLVANEGEIAEDGSYNPKGSISLIDLSGGAAAATAETVDFTAFDAQASTLAEYLRLTPGLLPSIDIEPEYIDIAKDGQTAFVTLQEVNGVAVLDISGTTPVIDRIVPLGTVDFSLPGNEGDFSDRDGPGNDPALNIVNQPVKGLLQPDALATFTIGDRTYFVTANEGDSRVDGSDEIRVGDDDYDLDPTAFPDAATLETNDELGRLTVSTLDGDTDGDGDYDEIYAFGGRGFSVFEVKSDGSVVKVDETGGEFEDIMAALPNALTVFNGENGDAFDSRSDNKSTEPEGVDVVDIGGKMYAFVALERAGGMMVYDVSTPSDVSFSQYVPPTEEDYGPEVVKIIDAGHSPTGETIVLTANEISGTVTAYEAESPTFTLQLLHYSDAEAGLLASDTAPNLAALVDRFEDEYVNTLILSSGDNFIPGPFLSAGSDPSVSAALREVFDNPTLATNIGRPDIAIHNLIGVEASAIGNHEWDLGSSIFAGAFRPAADWTGAAFPYVSANLDFSADSAINPAVTAGGQEASTIGGRVTPWTVVTEGTEKIGILGATTQILERISSPTGTEVNGFPKAGQPGDGTVEVDDMTLLASQLQPIIDQMISSGLNKIILTTHLQQIENEQLLATKLKGVDIIIAGGSNTRLGDATDDPGTFPGHTPEFDGNYPLSVTDADGKTTLIVNTDGEFTYLGRLVVEFDADGNIIPSSLDETVNGAYATDQETLEEVYGADIGDAFAEGSKGAEVKTITDAVQDVIDVKDGNVYGFTNVYLEGERSFVRNQETNLGNLTADANLLALEEALEEEGEDATYVVSLKNGGGIRAQIGTLENNDDGTVTKLPPPANPDVHKATGGVSQLDIENSLRFNNGLMMFDTTAEGLLAILEHGVAAYGNQGRFPQIGGVRFAFDDDLPAGERVTSVSLIDENDKVIAVLVENGEVVADAPSKISVITLNFMANGGDGYPMKENGENFRFLLTDGTLSAPVDESLDFTAAGVVPANILGEQETLGDYMERFHGSTVKAFNEVDTSIENDTRIQNLDFRTDTVNAGLQLSGGNTVDDLRGTGGHDNLFGNSGDDLLRGYAGDDQIRGGNGNDKAYGGAGDDHITGGIGADFLLGEAGDDRLDGEAGEDRLDGGAGNDSLYGGTGNDTILGRDGDDYASGGDAHDNIYGDAGNDRLDGNAGNDRLDGGDGDDRALGGDGNDILFGRAGDDRLEGEGAADILFGGDGQDYLLGGAGVDKLYGEAGNDRLAGGASNDHLHGGAGRDTFIFAAGDGFDRIYDFEDGLDRIDLRAFNLDSIEDIEIAQRGEAEHPYVVVSVADVMIHIDGIAARQLTDADFLF